MPQFDIFSFASQLFWVFLTFTLLYLSLCYYLLPSIAIILKVRKRKLAAISTSDDTNVITVATSSTSLNIALDKINSLTDAQTSFKQPELSKINLLVFESNSLKAFAAQQYKKVTSLTIL